MLPLERRQMKMNFIFLKLIFAPGSPSINERPFGTTPTLTPLLRRAHKGSHRH